MSLVYLTLGILAIRTANVLAGDVVRLNSLASQCQFMVDGNRFDLCPMFGLQESGGWLIQYERNTPPSITTTEYRIMIEGKLPKNTSLEDNMQCPDGTTICLTTSTRYESESPRVVNTVPVAGSLSEEARKPYVQSGEYSPGLNIDAEMVRRWKETEESLQITFHGGYYVDVKQSAVIFFICDEDHSKAKLEHVFTFYGKHTFAWRSPHACAQPGEGPPGSPDHTIDNGEGEQELAPPPAVNHTARRMWTIIFLSTFTTAVVAYLIYYPPRPLRRHVSRYLKSHPSFRVGENVLVRWAHDEIDLDEHEALVVDGDDINHYVDEEEHIPLKPSPRKGGIMTYGSA